MNRNQIQSAAAGLHIPPRPEVSDQLLMQLIMKEVRIDDEPITETMAKTIVDAYRYSGGDGFDIAKELISNHYWSDLNRSDCDELDKVDYIKDKEEERLVRQWVADHFHAAPLPVGTIVKFHTSNGGFEIGTIVDAMYDGLDKYLVQPIIGNGSRKPIVQWLGWQKPIFFEGDCA
jgi:hypothetical protein